MRFQPLTNVRPSKEQGTHLVTNTTRGSLKLTPKAIKILDVQDGDYCGVVKSGEAIFIFKGNEELGGKLAASKKGGAGDFNFSSSMAWETLGGNEDTKRYFEVSETPLAEEDVAGTPFEGNQLYPITFEKEVEKQARKAKEEKETNATVTAQATNTEELETASASSDFDNDDFSDL